MLCNKCGAPIQDGAVFCGSCGTNLKESSAAATPKSSNLRLGKNFSSRPVSSPDPHAHTKPEGSGFFTAAPGLESLSSDSNHSVSKSSGTGFTRIMNSGSRNFSNSRSGSSPGDSNISNTEIHVSSIIDSISDSSVSDSRETCRCPDCGSEMPKGAAFCTECGSAICDTGDSGTEAVYCPDCGSEMPAHAAFCTECGCVISEARVITTPPKKKKNLKPLWISLCAGAASVLLLVVILLALPKGTASAEKLVRNYIENTDYDTAERYALFGVDFSAMLKQIYSEIGDFDEFYEECEYALESAPDQYENFPYERLCKLLNDVETEDDLVEFAEEFTDAIYRCTAEEMGLTIEVLSAEGRKLSKGETQDCLENIEEFFDDYIMRDCMLYDVDDIDTIYLVECEYEATLDGESKRYDQDVYVLNVDGEQYIWADGEAATLLS